MDNLRKYKIFAFIALFAELIIFFALFGKIRNLIISYEIAERNTPIYVLLFLAMILFIFLFILTIILTYKKNPAEDYYQKKDILTDITKKEKTSDFEQKEELIDIENYTKKILPKDNAKLDLVKYTEKILSNIAKEFDIVQGLFFVKEKKSGIFDIAGKYAYFGEEEPKSFKIGESLSGQVAKNKKVLNLKDIPENYITILSGLGSSSPNYLLIIPIIMNDETIGIIELASFKEFKSNFSNLFEKISEQIGKVLVKY